MIIPLKNIKYFILTMSTELNLNELIKSTEQKESNELELDELDLELDEFDINDMTLTDSIDDNFKNIIY